MWTTFACACLAAAVVLFLPGYLLLRALALGRSWALCLAPVASVAAVCAMGELLNVLNLRSDPLLVLGLPVLVGGVAALARREALGPELPRMGWGPVAFAVLAGASVAAYTFVGNLGSPELVCPGLDVAHHYNTVQAMASSGRLSSFAQDYYMTAADQAIDPYPGAGFYPSAWQTCVALVCLVARGSAPLGANALNAVAAGAVVPLGALAWAAATGPSDPSAPHQDERFASLVQAGAALVSVSFAAFPWALLSYNAVFPNLLAFALVPSACAVAGLLLAARPGVGSLLALVPVALASLALSQPNAVFTLGVLVLPHVCVTLWARGRKAACATVGTAAVGLWVALWRMPALRAVVSTWWKAIATPDEALRNVAELAYTRGSDFLPRAFPQHALAALVLLGAAWIAVRRRERAGALLSYAVAALALVAAASLEAPWRSVLAGFWYADPFRCAAMLALAGMPLAAAGMEALVRGACGVARRLAKRAPRPGLVALAVALAFAALNFRGPYLRNDNTEAQTAFGAQQSAVRQTYGADDVYSLAERVFVARVRSAVGDALVANDPFDGSALAYGVSGLRTYWRYTSAYGDVGETEASRVLRERLCDVATDPEVRRLARELGLSYVVRLTPSPHAEDWLLGLTGDLFFGGVDAIADDTPGFELLLAEGDMRLYRLL